MTAPTVPAQPIRLTVDGVLGAMAAAVAARGRNYVYAPPEDDATCKYVHADCPSCLIGDVLHRAGVPLAWLLRRNSEPADELITYLRAERVVTADVAVADVLLAAQQIQDGTTGPAGTWGEALAEARVTAAMLGAVS
jgi:hypothetical protein